MASQKLLALTRENQQNVLVQSLKAVVHQTIVQTISVCLHFCMKQNSLPEKGEIIGTGRTYMNLNFAGRFPAEIV